MGQETFHIKGQILNKRNNVPIPGLIVEVWDKDVKYHSLLGREYTDSNGEFEVVFDETYFGDYGGDKLPDVFFKIFNGESLIYSTEERIVKNLDKRNSSFSFRIDQPISPVKRPKNSNAEIAIHELGESIAASLASVQQELARYPNNLGAFLVDEVDIELPVTLRVDKLGQVMATVVDHQEPDTIVGSLKLKVKPVIGAIQPPPIISEQSIKDLGVFSASAIKLLEKQRVFSVEDLLRVSRNSAGKNNLSQLKLGVDIEDVINRAQFLALPNIPSPIRKILLEEGIKNIKDFAEYSSTELANILSTKLEEKIPQQDIEAWQKEVKDFIKIPLPSRFNK